MMRWREHLALLSARDAANPPPPGLREKWDREAAFNRAVRQRAMKVLEDSGKMSAEELAAVRHALAL